MRSHLIKQRKPVGRPSRYDPGFCARVISLGEQGLGKAEIAAELGVACSNFDAWQKVHPEFQEAVKDAIRASQAWWEKQAQKHDPQSRMQHHVENRRNEPQLVWPVLWWVEKGVPETQYQKQ